VLSVSGFAPDDKMYAYQRDCDILKSCSTLQTILGNSEVARLDRVNLEIPSAAHEVLATSAASQTSKVLKRAANCRSTFC
jgi:hypothetical protein